MKELRHWDIKMRSSWHQALWWLVCLAVIRPERSQHVRVFGEAMGESKQDVHKWTVSLLLLWYGTRIPPIPRVVGHTRSPDWFRKKWNMEECSFLLCIWDGTSFWLSSSSSLPSPSPCMSLTFHPPSSHYPAPSLWTVKLIENPARKLPPR